MTGEWILAGFLLLFARQDIKRMQISRKLLIVATVTGLCLFCLPMAAKAIPGLHEIIPTADNGESGLYEYQQVTIGAGFLPRPFADMLFRFLPGATVLAGSFLSRGKIGPGDGMVFLICGLFLPVQDVLWLMCISFLAGAVLAAYWLLARKKQRQDSFPFLPCVFFAMMGHIALRLCS